MKIYVGNLSYRTTDDGLRSAFEDYGTVDSANIIIDRETGRSKGFGFVEMGNKDEAHSAMEALDNQSLDDRNIRVNEALPRQDNGRGRRDDSRRRY